MKILFISDTHGQHRKLQNLPEADMLIHGGDVSMHGAEEEVVDFVDWLDSLDYKHKIFIAGNHDDCLDGAELDGLPDGCHYLCNSGVTINGIKFWGVPFFVSDDIEGRCPELMRKIPTDTDVLITHRPPLEILDTTDGNAYGCLEILDAVLRTHPRYHLFGHIHGAYGVVESSPTTYINGSILNENYELTNQPVLIDMNEILIVPDVHGRQFWRLALDYPGQIIFLGDYFDPYPKEGIGETEALETFLRIISFKQKNPDRVTLLIGNHELHYYPESGKYSRFSPHCHVVINEMLTNDETKGLFQVCKQVGNYLFVHGGITKSWYKKHYEAFVGLGNTHEERLNRYFIENRAAFEEVSPNYRAGENEVSSPLWADIRELDAEGDDHFDNDIIQIVGHTQTDDEKILVINNVGAADNQKLHIFWNGEFDLYQ